MRLIWSNAPYLVQYAAERIQSLLTDLGEPQIEPESRVSDRVER